MQEKQKPIPIWNLLALLNNNTFIDGKGQQFKFEAVVKNKDTKQVIEDIPTTKCDLKIDESKIKDKNEDEKGISEEKVEDKNDEKGISEEKI